MKTQSLIPRITCPKTMAGRLTTACAMRLLPLLLLLLLALPAVVEAQFNYTTNNGTITITKYIGPGGAVTIPRTIQGLPVTSIGANAFTDCTNLSNVTIPNSVASIGDGAFDHCTSLTTVMIPDSVTSIGLYPFFSCISLTAITVDALNSVYSSVDGVLFNKSQTTLIQCPAGKAGSYTIPSSVTSIGGWAFSVCTSLTNVTIRNSVTNIGDSAFGGCRSLTSVTIPDSVTSIGDRAFQGCSGLTTVTIPDSVTSIRDGAFDGCTGLATVTIGSGITSISGSAFYYCTSLTSVYFQGNAPTIGWGVFDDDNKPIVYYLPGTTGWGTTFAGLPAFLWDPLSQAAYTTTNGAITITGYTGPGGSVTIPSTINGLPVTSIGNSAFEDCTSLTSVTIGTNVTSIGVQAFQGCSRLTSITIPNSVASIGDSAFLDCASLTNVMIPNSVTSIGNSAFEDCTSLNNVTIGNGVTSIGDYAFSACTKLTGVYFKCNGPSIGAYVLDGDHRATVYRLPWTTGWGRTFDGRPTVLWNPLSGTYNGLFADDTGSLHPQNCGCFTIISTLKGKGAFSGSLRMGGTRYPLSGQFDPAGAASRTIARRNTSALTVNLQLDLANGTDRVTGSVSDGTWTAALAGDRAIYDGRTKLAPEAGSYTMIIAGDYGSTNEPAGDSCGTLKVGKNGAISFTGTLADGTKVTPSASVSKYGQWPLYASLYGGRGLLWSWLTFTNASDLGGTVTWTKLPVKTPYYPAGFSLAPEALGARYFPPGKGTNVLGLTTSTDLTLTLEGGGLMQGVTNRITLAANGYVTPVSGPKLSLTFAPSTGGFRGSVVNPAAPKPVSFGGVLLQGGGFGSGFFLGTSGSGEVRLEP
ncbi:MAG: leucine-rich repeat domain-containing protein [Verrucomicrobiota bacterium]